MITQYLIKYFIFINIYSSESKTNKALVSNDCFVIRLTIFSYFIYIKYI